MSYGNYSNPKFSIIPYLKFFEAFTSSHWVLPACSFSSKRLKIFSTLGLDLNIRSRLGPVQIVFLANAPGVLMTISAISCTVVFNVFRKALLVAFLVYSRIRSKLFPPTPFPGKTISLNFPLATSLAILLRFFFISSFHHIIFPLSSNL